MTDLSKHGQARAATEEIPFSLKELKQAIPQHCWERSLLHALVYVLADLTCIGALACSTRLLDLAPAWLAWSLLWPAYWFLQGAVATGVWVIAHECGHQAFSKWQAVNDGVGLVLHSLLLVPYYSWKHSHRRHHSNTANIERDEVFVPESKEVVEDEDRFSWQEVPLVRAFWVLLVLTTGWPLYLATNASGRPYDRLANHFDPYSPIYSKRERSEIVVSDCALAAVVYGLYRLALAYGLAWLVKVWLIPYLIVNASLVMITLLQHTHPALPHYTTEKWSWLRGALATCDRSFGFLDTFHHHIADTHVLHHLFSTIPHYHAQEASAAIKPILGRFYCYDSRNVVKALWEDWYRCSYVAPDEGGDALWFRK